MEGLPPPPPPGSTSVGHQWILPVDELFINILLAIDMAASISSSLFGNHSLSVANDAQQTSPVSAIDYSGRSVELQLRHSIK